jgi:hypothetical protein
MADLGIEHDHPLKIGDHLFDIGAHVGQHGTQQDRRADAFQNIGGRNQQRRWRAAAHALEAGQDACHHILAGAELLAEQLFVARIAGEPFLGRCDTGLNLADLLRRLDASGNEAGAVSPQFGHVFFKLGFGADILVDGGAQLLKLAFTVELLVLGRFARQLLCAQRGTRHGKNRQKTCKKSESPCVHARQSIGKRRSVLWSAPEN